MTLPGHKMIVSRGMINVQYLRDAVGNFASPSFACVSGQAGDLEVHKPIGGDGDGIDGVVGLNGLGRGIGAND